MERTGRLLAVFSLIGIHHAASWFFNVNEDEERVALPFVLLPLLSSLPYPTHLTSIRLRFNLSYLVFFLVQPFGFVLERFFYQTTSRRVGGVFGAVWTWSFLLLFGIPVVDAMLQVDAGTGNGCGIDGEEVMPGKLTSSRSLVRLVASRVVA